MKNFRNYLILFFLGSNLNVQAGLNKYTPLDRIEGWIIERKIESSSGMISCRASFVSHGTWFGSRMRLDKSDKLIIPTNLIDYKIPNRKLLQRLKISLIECRKDFVYKILDQE